MASLNMIFTHLVILCREKLHVSDLVVLDVNHYKFVQGSFATKHAENSILTFDVFVA